MPLLADVGITISELKRSPSAALDAGHGRPVAILTQHDDPRRGDGCGVGKDRRTA
jgi:hypothetical protein